MHPQQGCVRLTNQDFQAKGPTDPFAFPPSTWNIVSPRFCLGDRPAAVHVYTHNSITTLSTLPMGSHCLTSHISYQILTLNIPPRVFPQLLLQRCLILLLLLFLFAFSFVLAFFLPFRIFLWLFILTTPILFFIHIITKLIHPFYMAIIHLLIPNTEPFVPLDKCLCTHCS